jgi:hypothetical protein
MGSMSSFDEREKSFERKFQQDQELAFKARARRNKLLGLWAAGELGLTGEAAQHYAQNVLCADLEQPGSDDIVNKVASDFAKAGVRHDATRVRVELERCAVEAKKQLGAPR